MKEPIYLTVKETADLLEMSPTSVRKLIQSKSLSALKVKGGHNIQGFSYVLDKKEVLKYKTSLVISRSIRTRNIDSDIEWISLKEAARLYRCTIDVIKKCINDGTLECKKEDNPGAVPFRYVVRKIKQEEFNKPLIIPIEGKKAWSIMDYFKNLLLFD